jgi:hypothetical protein
VLDGEARCPTYGPVESWLVVLRGAVAARRPDAVAIAPDFEERLVASLAEAPAAPPGMTTFGLQLPRRRPPGL